jgi:hypothetical protein
MSAEPKPDSAAESAPVGALAPWEKADLPPAPGAGWRLWIGLIGPGIVLAGTSVGSGEWLFGPAVTAQYGATLLWLALISIICQAFCNLMVMRYAIYCGEPMIVGGLRTRPGPAFWMICYAVMDIASIWPYNASNAAVPLAAAILGRLPQTESDNMLVKGLGFAIFLLAFVPLIFGGTVYRMLEKIMTAKLVVVLGYLGLLAIFMVSAPVAWSVATGFFRFGTVPIRANTIIVGRHFNIDDRYSPGRRVIVKGSWEDNGQASGELIVVEDGAKKTFDLTKPESIPADLVAARDRALALSKRFAESKTERVYFEAGAADDELIAEGRVENHHDWQAESLVVGTDAGDQEYSSLEAVPSPHRERFAELLKREGLEHVGLIGYVNEHKKLPPLDWAMVVAFIAIAGAGGLTNSMFSNYARDKGWGMGRHVGAIPSAIGGRTIGLSHTGKVFPTTAENLTRWRGWIRHIVRDQFVWIAASVIGMALPCMMSLEFIRNAPVTGNRVAAMTAEGIADRFPSYSTMFWFLTLFCGFLVLAPGQVSVGDQISRRWTDMFWNASPRLRRLGKGEVRYVYYGIMGLYCVWGLVVLWFFPALKIATIGAILQNIALGFVSLHALYVNRTLLPKELQPKWHMQIGVAICGLFFLGISVLVVLTL